MLKSEARPGDWVVVPGAGGGLGHMAVQYALALNCKVLAIDTGDEKRRLMESYGVHAWVDFAKEDVVRAVKEKTGDRVAAAVVTAGVIQPHQQVSWAVLQLLGAGPLRGWGGGVPKSEKRKGLNMKGWSGGWFGGRCWSIGERSS